MTKNELHKLLNLDVTYTSQNFIIYSEKLTPRLTYVIKFIFEIVLKVNYKIIDNVTEFETSKFYKINYSKREFKQAFQILPHLFLTENSVTENKPKAFFKDGLIYFFENENPKSNSNFSFDIFSAVFFFISRYEEWQVFEPDFHDRFEIKNSLLFQHNFHHKPMVDLWIMELKAALQIFNNEFKFPENKFKYISTIDVDNLYAFKAKGFIRTAGAICKDLIKLNFKNLSNRISVLLGKNNDPFDIYSNVSDLCLKNKIPLIYFFLFRSATKYDRTVDPTSNAFNDVFKRVKQYAAFIALHPSYNASVKKELLIEERNNIQNKSNQKITLSRQHYLRFNIRKTPLLLIEEGFYADFSMGFASNVGFRAGTSFPFYYYDFAAEKETQLLFVPFCAMDGAYFIYNNINPEQMLASLKSLALEVKRVNGFFITVFHERTFSSHLYPGYNHVYNNIIELIKDI